ncbi:MAG: ABC transporter ATP-binding protein [Clostridiales bacterium]|nr:ABC transporter ATP-binding protein [Clostridiales bacterium]MDY2900718.1 ABC transporter ATP-binding protein [Christensenellaceae bacterium]
MSFISLQNITKKYGSGETEITALDGVNLTIDKGEFVVILGSSGAGKSTLLNIIGGMDSASSGKYYVNGIDVTALSDKDLTLFRRHEVGFVFQFYNLMPNLTAKENVELSTRGVKNAIDAEESLELVGLGKRTDNFPYGLSGGEQQRVSIARAIAKRPSILLCDEPTGALDSKTGKNILILLKDLCEKDGQTVIIVTHNANISLIAERVIRLSDGKIVSDEKNPAPKEIDDIEW